MKDHPGLLKMQYATRNVSRYIGCKGGLISEIFSILEKICLNHYSPKEKMLSDLAYFLNWSQDEKLYVFVHALLCDVPINAMGKNIVICVYRQLHPFL